MRPEYYRAAATDAPPPRWPDPGQGASPPPRESTGGGLASAEDSPSAWAADWVDLGGEG